MEHIHYCSSESIYNKSSSLKTYISSFPASSHIISSQNSEHIILFWIYYKSFVSNYNYHLFSPNVGLDLFS
uniref:Uncharacterized protein n=1 Tax=Arundo donax TaxID=35708 RepID=A0A0A9FRK6_ARUDO